MAMDDEIEDLVKHLVRLEKEIEGKLEAQRETFQYRMEEGRAVFEDEVLRRHRRFRTGLVAFLRRSPLANILVAPAVYGLIVPLVILDVGVTAFQAVCFTVWRMERVRRSDYVVIDRHRLPYLNAIEKLNCVYCGYANGVIAYAREAASRTEQYWCPIKHALRRRTPHARYRHFIDYGDTRNFHERLEALRREVMTRPPTG
ncbi:MAG: hypothetical protein COW30_12040 [Rhodospirillales bacterium CG15_BIG_FIL_POST_REV_8_21_14_020_66_15]|nr:MAG: hypothetical protein COW30_12040 [Rhodospirillales bacterium CG15_BIG_FIL_POST_REV_8_21_14_020_66_15]